jgi:hypothetical protein
MQWTRHGKDGASPLISVFYVPMRSGAMGFRSVVPLLLASHGITSFGPLVLRACLTVGGIAVTLCFAPVLRAMYARPETRPGHIRPVEFMAIALLVVVAGVVGLAIWDATFSLG